MKKKWNTPTLIKLNIMKTANPGKNPGTYEGHKPHAGWQYIQKS